MQNMDQTEALMAMSSSAASLKQDGIEEGDFSRPMYKKDALYTRSVQSLAEFKKSENAEEFRRSQIDIPVEPSGVRRLGKVMLDILVEMTNFKLLIENKPFLLIVIANFFVFVGYFLPFIYIPIRGKELDISNIAMVLSVIGKYLKFQIILTTFSYFKGIVNIPSRIIFGIIADRKWITAFNINTMCFALLAVINFFYFLLNSLGFQVFYAIVFAIGMGSYLII
jgi:hypothetical protein